jgi:hypothetical protein
MVTAVVTVSAGIATLIVTGVSGRTTRPLGASVAAAAPTPSPTAAPGTILLTCEFANWGELVRSWRAGSLKVGPLWLYGGRRFAYLARRGVADARLATLSPGKRLSVVMIVEIADGSTVVMKAADKARSYFRFVDGFNGPAGNPLPRGDTGYTLSSCPKGDKGPNGAFTDFYLGFFIKAGRSALVDVRTSPTSHPTRLIFTIMRGRT